MSFRIALWQLAGYDTAVENRRDRTSAAFRRRIGKRMAVQKLERLQTSAAWRRVIE
jgi:hypothetical protein